LIALIRFKTSTVGFQYFGIILNPLPSFGQVHSKVI